MKGENNMEKLLGMVFIGLTFCNISFAEIKVIENKKIMMGIAPRWTTTIYVDSHKFVIFRDGVGISMAQAYEERDGKSLPAKC